MQADWKIGGNMTSFLQFTDTDCYRPFRVDLAGKAGKKLIEDKKSKENDVEFYYEMQQALKKDTERLKNDKTFWEFVKEGEDAMQIPEKEKIAASSFEKQEDFNHDIAVKRGFARNKLIPY